MGNNLISMTIDQKKNQEYKLIQYFIFILIPAFLWLDAGKQLQSISAYFYESPALFCVLLTMVGKLFFTEGYTNRKNYFEMIIGASLIGVVLTPCESLTAVNFGLFQVTIQQLHYFFALLFFEGEVFNMIYFSSGKYRIYTILLGFALNFAMAGCFFFGWYSIFWAEWLGMLPISIHKILENLKIID